MAKTIQKRIKFSKGQIAPELVERTDMEIYDASAQKMHNVISTVYGGVRTRAGTNFIDYITNLDEKSPTGITSNVFSDTSHFTDNDYKESNQIGSNKLIAQIDYGTNEYGAMNVMIKNVSVTRYELSYTTVGTQTVSIPKGLYEVYVVGAGSGGAADTDQPKYSYKARSTGGSSGGYARASINLNGGNYSITVGEGGNGANSRGWSTAGGSSSFDRYLTCSGGDRCYAEYKQEPRQGEGGSVTHKEGLIGISEYQGTKGEKGYGYASSKGANDQYLTYGGGGRAETGGTYGIGEKGHNGFVGLKLMDTDVVIGYYVSTDGQTWTKMGTTTITGANRDVEVSLTYRYRFVKFEIESEGSTLLNKIRLQYIKCSLSSGNLSAKLVDYVYNDTDKYLLVLSNEQIQVFKDDTLKAVVQATGLKKEYFPFLKWSSKDDTIIFTHQDMHPKILKRSSDVSWRFSDLQIDNIPYVLFGEEVETPYTVGITPTSVQGVVKLTADSSVFDSSWVGQYIDGNGGRIKITEYTSATVVKGHTTIPLYTTDKITSWKKLGGYEPVWSTSRGYPRCCLFAQQRLWFGGSRSKPAGIWASRLGDYFNFRDSGSYDNDSISVDLVTNDIIMNMVDNRGLHIFTSGQEITASEGTYTPNAITFTINTKNGSYGQVKPVIFDGTVCFIEKNGKSLLSYVYDYEQASYLTDNISLFSTLFRNPVSMAAEINSSRDKGDFLYVVLDDGTMLTGCIKIDQEILSVSKFVTNGKILDVACLRDDRYILVERGGRTCLERIENDSRTDSQIRVFADSDTLMGMYRFTDNYVHVWSDTRDYGKIKCGDGVINLGEGVIPNEYVNIGIIYEYELQSNPIAINNQSTNIKKRIAKAVITCENTPRLNFCTQQKSNKNVYEFFRCTKYDEDVRFTISGEFYPINVLSVQLNIDYEG